MNSVPMLSPNTGANEQSYFSRASTDLPGDLENKVLRQAVQENLVSFPSQVPIFERRSRPYLQQKVVALYFVCGWTMDDIAKRYLLGRQRIGQILTAWRIRAVKEGYIQAIEPEHPLFQRVRLEQASQFAEMPQRASSPASSIVEAPKGLHCEQTPPGPTVSQPEVHQPGPAITELKGSNLAEELHAIVGVLDNQLRLCSKSLNGNIHSCEQLLDRARTLCALLETQPAAIRGRDDWRTAAAVSAAKGLFQRFQEQLSSVTNNLSMPPRTSQRVAVRL